MLLAYNTNGLAHHDLLDAIRLLADIGYQGVAITLDHGALNPFDDRTRCAARSKSPPHLRSIELRCVIETGARFLLDPRTKHEPTLVTADPAGRAAARRFSLPGDRHRRPPERRLRVALVRRRPRRGRASARHFRGSSAAWPTSWSMPSEKASCSPSSPSPACSSTRWPGTTTCWTSLPPSDIDAARLRLTIDIGHLHCQGELPIAEQIVDWRDRLANVHIEDMRPASTST